MSAEKIRSDILTHLGHERYKPTKPRKLARVLDLHGDEDYPRFKSAVRRTRRGRSVGIASFDSKISNAAPSRPRPEGRLSA